MIGAVQIYVRPDGCLQAKPVSKNCPEISHALSLLFFIASFNLKQRGKKLNLFVCYIFRRALLVFVQRRPFYACTDKILFFDFLRSLCLFVHVKFPMQIFRQKSPPPNSFCCPLCLNMLYTYLCRPCPYPRNACFLLPNLHHNISHSLEGIRIRYPPVFWVQLPFLYY